MARAKVNKEPDLLAILDEGERVWNLSHFMDAIGPDATHDDAVALRDLLVDGGWLKWISDRDGGSLTMPPEDEWLRLLARACGDDGDE